MPINLIYHFHKPYLYISMLSVLIVPCFTVGEACPLLAVNRRREDDGINGFARSRSVYRISHEEALVLELHQLRTFCHVVQEASFSRAAQALHLTQPAVSQQIRVLEEEMGVKLLQRVGGVRPTRAGEVLLEYAQGLLTLAERGQAALAEFRAEKRGRLILGAGNTTITFRLPTLLREYRHREQGVEVIVHAGNSASFAHSAGAGTA